MQNSKIFTLFSFLILIFSVCNALNCSILPPKVIDVNQSGKEGSFKTIQSAIESIPQPNTQWTHIRISAGIYTENVFISKQRSCIFLEGAGSYFTIIQASAHETMGSSATFASLANDIIAKGITFKAIEKCDRRCDLNCNCDANTYNNPLLAQATKGNVPALAAKVEGDRTAFYNCSFKGVQDTLWDRSGRHYFHYCYIQGAVDFIFGDGQSIYENCVINFTMGADGPVGQDGTITAQKRESMDSPTGFVFKECLITGINGRTQLGRAYGPFSRVIIANSYLTNVVRPEGWSTWQQSPEHLTFVEINNTGPGADMTNRVKWVKKNWDTKDLDNFLSISYINHGGWIEKQRSANNL